MGTRKCCSSLEDDIKAMLTDKKQLQVEVTSLKWDSLSDSQTLERYRSKMKKYCQSVEKYLQESEVSSQLEKLRLSHDLLQQKGIHYEGEDEIGTYFSFHEEILKMLLRFTKYGVFDGRFFKIVSLVL